MTPDWPAIIAMVETANGPGICGPRQPMLAHAMSAHRNGTCLHPLSFETMRRDREAHLRAVRAKQMDERT